MNLAMVFVGGEVRGDLGPWLRENVGHECHVIDRAWAVRTNMEPEAIAERLIESGIIDSDEQCVVAPIKGPWFGGQCQSLVECYDE